ncbi:hypothetical protein CEXT_287651 [Caerostris extrusa]|uniref:Uncharacterized protein n=1 Tax=Caerostris extrusa TaxID=172846 RepID=A0AAV4UJ05_CAEEX|nr:hypothetical protein CEXT_287651 [Caerostris extrusa]
MLNVWVEVATFRMRGVFFENRLNKTYQNVSLSIIPLHEVSWLALSAIALLHDQQVLPVIEIPADQCGREALLESDITVKRRWKAGRQGSNRKNNSESVARGNRRAPTPTHRHCDEKRLRLHKDGEWHLDGFFFFFFS